MKKESIEEYNTIRVFATILVVIGHAGYISPQTDFGGIQMFDYSIPVIQKIIDLGIRLIYSFHMPLFFALSGALFYRSVSRRTVLSFRMLLKNKGRRLFIPFVVCSIFWNIPIKYLSGYWNESSSLVDDIVVGQLFLAGNTHLWFLWCLFVLTMLAYLLRNHNQIRILVAITLFLVGGCSNLTILGIQDILTNFIWFECGMLFEKKREWLQQLFLRYKWICTISGIFLYGCVLFLYLLFCKGNVYAYGIVNFCGIVCVFVGVFHLKETNIMNCAWYGIILKHSFYIYLLADTMNYPVLAIIKRLELRCILETNIGAGALFFFRIIVPICLAIICERMIKKFNKGYIYMLSKRDR